MLGETRYFILKIGMPFLVVLTSSGRRRWNGPCTIRSFASCRGYTAASRCHKSIQCGAPLAKLAALRCPTPSASEARNFRSSGASQSNARTSSLHVRLAMRLATEQFRACAYCRPQHAAQPLRLHPSSTWRKHRPDNASTRCIEKRVD